MNLNNKNALVTGATGGLGSEIVAALCKSGSRVFITGRNRSSLEVMSDKFGDHCLGFLECDLEKEDEIKLLVSCAQRASTFKRGNIDILINCAGIFPVSSVEEAEIEDFDRCINVNVRAPFILSKLLYPAMKESGWGRIVNIGSSSAYGGFQNTSIYCASKHALLGLSRSMYDEFKNKGVRVFSISPGSIQTSMGEKVQNQDYSTFMDPKEIADFISKVISYDANMILEEVRLNRVCIR